MKEVNFQVLGDMVLLEAREVKETTESGLIKAQSQIDAEKKDLDDFFTVMGVGGKVKEIAVGDQVRISASSHTQYNIDDEFYMIVSEMQILGKRKK